MIRRLLPALACLLLAQLALGADSTAVAASTPATPVPTATTTGPLPDARQILRDFLAASGGAKALEAMQNVVIDGTQSAPAMGISGKLQIHIARPNLLLVRGELQGIGKIEQGYDGKIGWDINP